MKSYSLCFLVACGTLTLLLSGCVPADKEYGMCTDLGLCPDDCDKDDTDCQSAKEGFPYGTHDSTADHSPSHDSTSDSY